MADKGFHLKVLVPTDDGFTISKNGIEGALYFLTYNVSNRSYQLSEKVKHTNIFNNQFNWSILADYCNEHLVDIILNNKTTNLLKGIKVKVVEPSEIGAFLNQLIDIIDSGNEF